MNAEVAVIVPRDLALAEAAPAAGSIMEALARAAASPKVNIEKMERIWAMQVALLARESEKSFNAAMSLAQSEMERISAEAENKQTRSMYASYGQIDRALRPIYTRHGFALSFGEAESPKPDHIRLLCYVSHRDGHSRTYHIDLCNDGKGAKGGDVMTRTHATGSAHTYGKRYLVKDIFNVAIGEDDDDGNGGRAGKDTPILITEKQIADLDALISEHKGNKVKLLQYLKLSSFAEIPAANYKFVVEDVRRLARARAEARS